MRLQQHTNKAVLLVDIQSRIVFEFILFKLLNNNDLLVWQLHDNQLSSLPTALKELEELQQLRLRYTNTYLHAETQKHNFNFLHFWGHFVNLHSFSGDLPIN